VNTEPTPPASRVDTRTHYDPRLLGGGAVVPYVASWTGETSTFPTMTNRTGGGIAYGDETLVDRDEWDVLWVRTASRIGVGRPLYKSLHPLRQRRAMLRLLCQVCAQPAGRTEQGNLWLLPAQGGVSVERLEDAPVTMPPVCVACARLSVLMCPALRSAYVAVRAHSRVCGVSGVRFELGLRGPQPIAHDDPDRVFDYRDPIILWVLATQRVRSLHECVAVDLDRL
jgi:hypothetical protein